MSTITAKHLLRAGNTAALVWCLVTASACSTAPRAEKDLRVDANSGAAQPHKPADGSCEPTCGTSCDIDDGCGGTCKCSGAQRCNDDKVCVDTECGDSCKSFEMCIAGRCVCEPDCDGHACENDGCGGTCACPDGYVQNKDGKFVPGDECHDTCEAAAWSCGKLCGQDCGSCHDGDECNLGSCECKPVCDGTRCDDGCGGSCECAAGTVCNAKSDCVAPAACHDSCTSTDRTCGEMCGHPCGECADSESCFGGECVPATSCEDCSLSFKVIARNAVGGRLQEVTLAIEYTPAEGEGRPRMADFRIRSNRPVKLVEATAEDALTAAGKQLYVDPLTHKPWQKHPDGSYQLLAYRATNVNEFTPGRLITARFTLDELGPVKFWLVRRLETFAPPEADSALQASKYDALVVVSP